MNAKDLMIGDWIHRCYTCSDTGREVVIDFQLTEIRNLAKSLYVCSEKGVVCKVEDAEPIPLTPEILEKNGWEWNGEIWINTDILFALENGYDREIRYWWHMFDSPIVQINFVHQLQHALRLCGIDKDLII